jgi:hypothetical protein
MPKSDENIFELGWKKILAITVLIILSTIDKLSIGPLELKGGPTLVGLAALIILWPVFRRMADRGGSAEVLGMKVQLNSLEKLTEEEYAIRLEELRSDIEELRNNLAFRPEGSTEEPISNDAEMIEKDFFRSVADYRANQDIAQWKNRVQTDKKLTAGVGRMPLSRIKKILADSSQDQEIAMAAAVSLGVLYPGEDDSEAAHALVGLLKSQFERARFRAIRSIIRRASRSDTTVQAHRIMTEGVRDCIKEETSPAVYDPLQEALTKLNNT